APAGEHHIGCFRDDVLERGVVVADDGQPAHLVRAVHSTECVGSVGEPTDSDDLVGGTDRQHTGHHVAVTVDEQAFRLGRVGELLAAVGDGDLVVPCGCVAGFVIGATPGEGDDAGEGAGREQGNTTRCSGGDHDAVVSGVDARVGVEPGPSTRCS